MSFPRLFAAFAVTLLALPSAGAAVALVGSARLDARTHSGCGINELGEIAVTMRDGALASFHYRGLLNDVHGNDDYAVWDAATLLPLGYFCRQGEIAEVLRVESFEVDCASGYARIEAANGFFQSLSLTARAGCV